MKVAMVRKLAVNRHKSHWRNSGLDFFSKRIVEEMGELREVVLAGASVEEVWDEAADIANFAAMIAANYEESRREARAEWAIGS